MDPLMLRHHRLSPLNDCLPRLLLVSQVHNFGRRALVCVPSQDNNMYPLNEALFVKSPTSPLLLPHHLHLRSLSSQSPTRGPSSPTSPLQPQPFKTTTMYLSPFLVDPRSQSMRLDSLASCKSSFLIESPSVAWYVHLWCTISCKHH